MKKSMFIAAFAFAAFAMIFSGCQNASKVEIISHIGVVTGTIGQTKAEFRGAEDLVKQYGSISGGGFIEHVILPDAWSADAESAIQQITKLAEDPQMAAIIVSPAVAITAEAFTRIRAAKPDILLLAYGSTAEVRPLEGIADLVTSADYAARGWQIVWTAKLMGATSFLNFTVPSRSADAEYARRMDVIKRACAEQGLAYAEEPVADPANAGQAIADLVAKAVEADPQTAFYCADDSLASGLIGQVAANGGIFVETDSPEPLEGYSAALNLDFGDGSDTLLDISRNGLFALVKSVEEALAVKDANITRDSDPVKAIYPIMGRLEGLVAKASSAFNAREKLVTNANEAIESARNALEKFESEIAPVASLGAAAAAESVDAAAEEGAGEEAAVGEEEAPAEPAADAGDDLGMNSELGLDFDLPDFSEEETAVEGGDASSGPVGDALKAIGAEIKALKRVSGETGSPIVLEIISTLDGQYISLSLASDDPEKGPGASERTFKKSIKSIASLAKKLETSAEAVKKLVEERDKVTRLHSNEFLARIDAIHAVILDLPDDAADKAALIEGNDSLKAAWESGDLESSQAAVDAFAEAVAAMESTASTKSIAKELKASSAIVKKTIADYQANNAKASKGAKSGFARLRSLTSALEALYASAGDALYEIDQAIIAKAAVAKECFASAGEPLAAMTTLSPAARAKAELEMSAFEESIDAQEMDRAADAVKVFIEAINSKGRFGTLIFSEGYASTAGLAEYALLVLKTTATKVKDPTTGAESVKIDRSTLAMDSKKLIEGFKKWTPGVDWNGLVRIDPKTGAKIEKHIHMYQDIYRLQVGYSLVVQQAIPEAFFRDAVPPAPAKKPGR